MLLKSLNLPIMPLLTTKSAAFSWSSHIWAFMKKYFFIWLQIQNKRFNVEEIVTILLQILNGVMELHTGNFYHLDIKP